MHSLRPPLLGTLSAQLFTPPFSSVVKELYASQRSHSHSRALPFSSFFALLLLEIFCFLMLSLLCSFVLTSFYLSSTRISFMDSLTDERQRISLGLVSFRVHSESVSTCTVPCYRGARLSSNATLRTLLFRYFVYFLAQSAKNSIKRQVGPTGREGKSNRFMQENDENKSINGEFLARQRDD